jgi:hypothetical protein
MCRHGVLMFLPTSSLARASYERLKHQPADSGYPRRLLRLRSQNQLRRAHLRIRLRRLHGVEYFGLSLSMTDYPKP